MVTDQKLGSALTMRFWKSHGAIGGVSEHRQRDKIEMGGYESKREQRAESEEQTYTLFTVLTRACERVFKRARPHDFVHLSW
jgi:hypothetical protein